MVKCLNILLQRLFHLCRRVETIFMPQLTMVGGDHYVFGLSGRPVGVCLLSANIYFAWRDRYLCRINDDTETRHKDSLYDCALFKRSEVKYQGHSETNCLQHYKLIDLVMTLARSISINLVAESYTSTMRVWGSITCTNDWWIFCSASEFT